MKTFLILCMALFINGTPAAEENIVREIKIIGQDGQIVRSKIYLKGTEIRKTDSDGKCELPKNCNTGDIYEIVPNNGRDYKGKTFNCPNKKNTYILLTDNQATNIKKNSIELVKYVERISKNDSSLINTEFDKKRIAAISALSSNEFYAYYRNQSELADSARINTIKMTGIFLNVDNAIWVNPATKYPKESEELIRNIKMWQLENNLKVTGKIDGITLSAMAKTSSIEVYNIDFSQKVNVEF